MIPDCVDASGENFVRVGEPLASEPHIMQDC